VVAKRDRVDPGGNQLVGELWRDAQAARNVLAVDDHERRLVALAQDRQALQQRAPADAAHHVADEQDADAPAAAGPPVARAASRRLLLLGGRLFLSHTLAMVGGT